MEHSDDPEVKKTVAINTVHAEESTGTLDILISHYSSWYRLRRAIAWILRVKKYLLHKIKQRNTVKDPEHHQDKENTDKAVLTDEHKEQQFCGISPLTLADVQEAENAVIMYVQKGAYQEEIKTLSKSPEHNNGPDEKVKIRSHHSVKKSSTISKLNPFMMDGMLRVGGRLANAALPEETRFPIILPKKSHVAELILHNIHHYTGHGGRSHMLACLHKKYWIPSANAAARRIIHQCVICKRHKCKVGEQKMADLPADRLTPDDPRLPGWA